MVNARIDLSELNRELGAFKQEFETWSQKTITEAEDDRDMHLKRLKECEGKAFGSLCPLQRSIRCIYRKNVINVGKLFGVCSDATCIRALWCYRHMERRMNWFGVLVFSGLINHRTMSKIIHCKSND